MTIITATLPLNIPPCERFVMVITTSSVWLIRNGCVHFQVAGRYVTAGTKHVTWQSLAWLVTK